MDQVCTRANKSNFIHRIYMSEGIRICCICHDDDQNEKTRILKICGCTDGCVCIECYFAMNRDACPICRRPILDLYYIVQKLVAFVVCEGMFIALHSGVRLCFAVLFFYLEFDTMLVNLCFLAIFAYSPFHFMIHLCTLVPVFKILGHLTAFMLHRT